MLVIVHGLPGSGSLPKKRKISKPTTTGQSSSTRTRIMTSPGIPAGDSTPDQAKAEPAAIRRVGKFRHRGLVGALLMTPIAILVLTSPPLVREDAISGQVLNTLGWLAFLTYAAIRVWATLFIGGRKNDVLQVDGPYSICRNPLYLGSACFGLSIAFFLKSLTFGGVLLGAFLYYWLFVVPAEEKFLESRFGETFREFCRRTPRFWPRFSALQSPKSVTVDIKFLRIEAARLARGTMVPVALTILMHFRESPWWPSWFRLP
jgi:protein-S-isoprenylcysteine O-methyltransferase Ste14